MNTLLISITFNLLTCEGQKYMFCLSPFLISNKVANFYEFWYEYVLLEATLSSCVLI